MRLLYSLLCLLFITSCTQPCVQEKCIPQTYFESPDTGVLNGGIKVIPIQTPKGVFKVWTKRIGNNPKIKLLLLHGGPGTGHEYFECMESFLPQEGIEFIYYDQLGTCNSDKPTDTSLWDLSRFVDELEQVRQALKLDSSNLYLLGHSWGGILAMEYALKYQQHLKGLIISDMMADAKAYGKYADEVLAKKLPAAVLDTIRAIEHRGDFSNPQYMGLLMPHFYEKFICRIPLEQWPEPVNRAFAKLNQQQYVIMQGPSEFGISGKLTNWDRSKDISSIKVKTLVIGAKFDTMDPAYMEWMSKQINGAAFHLCANGSHMCMWDDQKSYFKRLIDFLKS